MVGSIFDQIPIDSSMRFAALANLSSKRDISFLSSDTPCPFPVADIFFSSFNHQIDSSLELLASSNRPQTLSL